MKKLLKNLYTVLPFKKQVFLSLKKIWQPSEKIYKHLHFKGIIDIAIDKEHSFKMRHYGYVVENDIFWTGLTGGWEKVSLALWIELSRNAQVIIDAGANTGIYSLISKCINPAADVIAFEPVNRVYEKLQANISLNDYNIKALKVALSNQSGEALIYDTMSEHTYSVTVNENRNLPEENVVPVTIQTTTLDDYIKLQNISKIDLIKIDVETHEPEVLEGYLQHIENHKPAILIEILNDEVGKKVQELVESFHYLYFNIGEEKGIRQVTQITQSDHFNYLLCDRKTALLLRLI